MGGNQFAQFIKYTLKIKYQDGDPQLYCNIGTKQNTVEEFIEAILKRQNLLREQKALRRNH